MSTSEVRLALPSKGRLAQDALDLLDHVDLRVHKANSRQYRAAIPNLPGLTVFFQRPADIVTGVRNGSLDFGITGRDVVAEQCGDGDQVLTLYPSLGFGHCSLNVIVPESEGAVSCMRDLVSWQARLKRPLRVATKFPFLTRVFFDRQGLEDVHLVSANGTLEIAPSIGYADLIVDLVSTGTTLRDNRLRALPDGLILESQACLIGNRATLKRSASALSIAMQLLEFIVAHRRAAENVAISANIQGESVDAIAARIHARSVIGGLQGPTIAPIIPRTESGLSWFAINIIVRKDQMARAVAELREIGGSGVVVTPVLYIFEKEPQACKDMLKALED